ncbi:hypothetical protein E1301_Tti015355 [Triplophysa tibetana]|uniref:Uncharacterized protein n=1 Tax=Triplophysa tibetana TaxID=1572043 RepID=A0A5A9PSI5_9TELE|nr:hypothetical protein E1301_Tti015355 [Triplophysa tibetana]
MGANVEAEIDVVFNETAPQSLPVNAEIVEALKEASKNPTFQSNLPLLESSITVIRDLQKIPVTFLTNGTFVPDLLNAASNPFLDRASMIKVWLEPFFISDYRSSFSVLYMTNFSSYSSGVKAVIFPTIKNAMILNFPSNTTLPIDTRIVNTLLQAANNNSLPFKIFPYSIVVNGIAYSSAEVISRTSVLTASILVVLSLLVTRFD